MLIEALWEDRPPTRALGTVRTYVSRLRQRLEPDRDGGPAQLLVSVTGGYALRIDPDSADVHRFDDLVHKAEQATMRDDHASAAESLREALALWGAEPLAGLPGTYAEGRRRQLVERRTAVAEMCFEAELVLGRHREILDELAAQAAAAPDREGLQRQWMLALYLSGRQAEALEVYGRTRDYLAQTFGTRPGPELEELHARVLSGDPDPEPGSEGDRERPTPAQQVRVLNQPMQLPGDVAGFSGRKGELDEVQAALTGRSRGTEPPVVVVTGIGGVGKSTLVVRAAHSIRHRFPDGQLYTDLRGVDDEPADPQNVLQRFLRAFGIPAGEIPTDLEIAAELFRTTLAGRKVLVVLDNARDVEQVRPLLAGPEGTEGCATVVTSRWRLTDLPATKAISLDVLEAPEAASMFAEIVGKQRVEREPQAAADLLAAGGNLPLSVRILAARLVARPAWTIASLASRLDDERHRLDELEAGELAVSATFHLSFAQLDKDRQRACRLLALYSGPAIVPASAAALLGTSREEAAAVCDSLVEAGLLDERVRHEYRFHDLVRLFARRRGDLDAPGDAADAVCRLLDLYLATVKHLSGVIRPNSPFAAQHPATEHDPITADDPEAARTWIATEADGIVDACRLGGDVRSLELAASLALFLVLSTDTAAMGVRLADLSKQLAERAVELGAPAPEAMARITRASALHFYQADVQGAIHELLLARRAADLGGVVFARSEAEHQAARFLLPTGRIEEAAELLESALRGYREAESASDEAEVLAVLAETLAKLGKFEEAYAAADRATEIHRGLGTVSGEAEALLRSGSARLLGGDSDRALSDLKTSADLYRTIGERGWLSKSLERYAAAMLQAGREAEAITVAEEALTLSRETEFMLGSGRALTTLGHALALVGDLGRAEVCWREAYDIFKTAGVQEAGRLAELLKLETAGCASG